MRRKKTVQALDAVESEQTREGVGGEWSWEPASFTIQGAAQDVGKGRAAAT